MMKQMFLLVLPVFRVTGGTYFWQFSFFDGAEEGVYYRPDSTDTLAPKFSHHRLTCFEFADGLNPYLLYF